MAQYVGETRTGFEWLVDAIAAGIGARGIEILPRPRHALVITFGLLACVFATPACLLLPRIQRAGTDAISGLVA